MRSTEIIKQHKVKSEKEKSYRQLQEISEELRQERRKTRDRLQAQVMRNVVLASNETAKRKRPSLDESSLENRPSKKSFPVNKPKSSGQALAPKNAREDKPPATSSKVKNT